MADLLLTVEYGGYISIVKLLTLVVMFFLWLPIVSWVNIDAEAVETKTLLWTALVFGTGAVALIVWMLLPIFIIGMLLYLIAVGSVSISYVMHRNARVMDYDRVLTPDHIKNLLSRKKTDSLKGLVFITANNNEVPLPQPKTPEFYGYKTAHDIFTDAIWRRADKILFTPGAQAYSVTYQVDGAPLKQPEIPREQMEYCINFVKQLADLDTKEKRKPQQGRFKTQKEQQANLDWVVLTSGSTAGEQLRIEKLIQQDVLRLADIGVTKDQLDQLNNICRLKEGLFIVSGPRKTGVTTTFYALLRNHDAFLNSISTLEKHPSADLPNITQNTFTLSDTGTTTYSRKLQSIVRMAPDIVGVADCEDSETAKVATTAAKDAKIIYATLQADSVLKAIGKWMKLVGDKNLAIDVLLGVINQRLIRKLCEECKQAYSPNKELLQKLNIPDEKAKILHRPGKVQYDKHGKPVTCENCQGTGFFGRTGSFELIMIDNKLKDALKSAKSLSEINTNLRGAKMLYLQEQILKKVINGTTAINEMIRVMSLSDKKVKKPQRE